MLRDLLESPSLTLIRRQDLLCPRELEEAREIARAAMPLGDAQEQERLAGDIVAGRVLVGRAAPGPSDAAPVVDLALAKIGAGLR